MNMKNHLYVICTLILFLIIPLSIHSQGHTNQNKFRQFYNDLATPNSYRTASGAPGHEYYQQKADYQMSIEIDDENQKLIGSQIITYHNNSPDNLPYLWVQMDQNKFSKTSQSYDRMNFGIDNRFTHYETAPGFINENVLDEKFDGGFKVKFVKDEAGKKMRFLINQTMMRIDLNKPLKTGQKIEINIDWEYNIINRRVFETRSGYEYFPKDDNYAYFIAQFFPRMAVYNDVEGWQNQQFWGNGEFALPFGDYDVKITVPNDHIVEGTGVLINRESVYSKRMLDRFEEAKKSYDEPVIIVSQEEAIINEKSKPTGKKTWYFKAKNVRDFAFASSRKFVLDMMNVDINGNDVMAVSVYPKEGNPLWEKWSTKTVASALKTYSRMTFDYPYHKAVSIHSEGFGMEYPMISFNFGRPDENGKYSDRTKYGMIMVIIHEIGHFFFPMIVNSDERQWGWMDEGINSFVQIIAEQDFAEKYPEAVKGNANKYPLFGDVDPQSIIPYMSGDQNFIAPIMSNPENVYNLSANAYSKPAVALNILRETVMGRELFDYAFKVFSERWKFKHPTPEDFFRTMEDASAFDLDWYWRGWFFTTDVVDIGVKDVKKTKGIESRLFTYAYLDSYSNLSEQQLKTQKKNKNTYKVIFEKPGGIPMPLIVDYKFSDGSITRKNYPAQVWRKDDKNVIKYISSNKELIGVVVDPDNATADINKNNNKWPYVIEENDFEKFKKSRN